MAQVTLRNSFKQPIRTYIIDAIDTEGYENAEPTVQFVYDCFKREYSHSIERLGERKAFPEWLRGLPSAISITHWTDEQEQLLKGWIEAAGGTFDEKRFTDEIFYHFIAREFFAMLNR